MRRTTRRGFLVTLLTVAAVVGAVLSSPRSAAAAGGNISLSLAKTVTSATFVPTLSATLTTDRTTAIPGDTVRYTVHLTNTGAALTVAGGVTAANGQDAGGTVVDWYDEIEFKDPVTGSWAPIGGYQATQAGYTPVSPSPAATGLAVNFTGNAASGVTYPSSGDHVLGTAIGAGATASWSYSVTLTVPAAVVLRLAAAAHTGGLRNVVHIEATPRPNGNQPFIVRTEFTNPFNGASAALTNARVAFTLPDGGTRIVDSAAVPALASIAVGATVNASTSWSVPVPTPPSADESDAAYLSRLGALQGAALVAHATASATGSGTTVTADAGSVTTTEQLPIVTVGKTGPDTLDAGATGTYTLPLTNSGGATASGITLTDRVPDGAHGALSGVPGSLAAGAGASATATFPVPTTQPDGPLTDTAQVTWADANGNPYGPLSASFTTTITSSLAGATLSLSPTVAGPDVVGTDQALTVTLVDRNGVPVANTAATVTVTGANSASGTVTTDSSGTAVFHYSGTGPGLDTAQATVVAGALHLQSNTSQIGWVAPIAPVSTTPVTGNFYTEAATAQTFVAKPTDTPTFGQTFPSITFNPSSTALPHNVTGVGPTTHPFTDVTTDMVGNGIGTIIAQGNGKQAGIAPMTSFDAVFTANLVVAAPGDITFQFDYDAGFMFGVNGGASRVNGVYEGAPASNTSAFQGFPLVGADNTASNAVRTSFVTVHFPAAGSYPYEIDYTESGGPTLSLVMSTATFTQDQSGLNVYAGYADGLRPGGSIFPFPWNGSPNTVFVGCTGNCQFDAGAVRLDNTTGRAVTINSLTVDIGNNCRFAIWPASVNLPNGQSALFTQTISGASSGCPHDGSFDTSDAPFITCTPTGIIPHITFVVDGVTHAFDDTQQILNTKGTDKAQCPGGNESQAWTRLGGTGTPVNTPLPPAGSVTLSPLGGTATVTSVQAAAGTAQSFRVAVMDASGLPVASTPVDVTIAGAHPGHLLATTGADGTAVVSYNAASAGDDTLQARAFITGLSTQSGILTVHWALPPGTVPDPGNPGQTLPAPPPVIAAPLPADGTRVTAPVPVTADITPPAGETISSWKVTVQGSAPGSPVLTLASGSGTPPATLATLDPTVLPDDTYRITVSATSSGGGIQTSTSTVAVAGNLKLGRYTTVHEDLAASVAGFRMSVQRSYDSIDKRVGDFGVGSRVALGNFRISANRVLGAGGWTEYPTTCGLFGCQWAFKSSVPHYVTVTYPDQHQEVFDFTPSGGFSVFYFFGTAQFTPRAGTGTTSTLEALDNSISYDFAGNIDSFLDGLYSPTRFKLTTADGRVLILDTTSGLVSETDRNGNSLSVDANGVHSSTGASLTFTRDGQGRITTVTGPAGEHVGYAYTPAGDLASYTDAGGRVTTYTYDGNHDLLTITPPGGPAEQLIYGSDGRLSQQIDGSGNVTQLVDDVGQRTQTILDPNGKLVTVNHFDVLGDLVESDRTADGQTLTTSYTYDAVGHLLSTTDPLGRVTSTTYDANGNVTSQTDAAHNTTTYGYDAKNELVVATGPGNTPLFTIGYDANGNTTSVTRADATGSSYTYDTHGNPLTITDAVGRTQHMSYDSGGHLVSTTDPSGQITLLHFDASNRLLTQTDPLGHTTSYTYDGTGNLLSITDGNGHSRSFTYDVFGNELTGTDALGHTVAYQYDPAGHTTSVTDRDNRVVTSEYDADGKLVRQTAPGGDVLTVTRDGFGRPTVLANPTGTLAFTYDADGEALTVVSAGPGLPSVTLHYTYSPDGKPATLTGPDGTTSYAYDTLQRLHSVTAPGDGGPTTFGYDSASRLSTVSRPDGVDDTLTYQSSTDLLSRTSAAGGTTVAGTTYTYNVNGQRASAAGAGLAAPQTYTYDPIGQLTGVTPAGGVLQPYAYDAAQNRTQGPGLPSGTATYDAGSRLDRDATDSYTYDNSGEMLTRTDLATGATTTYDWNARHQLTGVHFPDGSAESFRYDPLGHRVAIVDGTSTTTYVYSGDAIHLQYNGSGSLVATYTAGIAPDDVLEMSTGGHRYSYLRDGLNSVVALADESGTVVQRYQYDEFGRPVSATGGVANPFSYTGREYDPHSGLYYYRARWYDPTLGRFISEDPVLHPNPYAYVENDPTNKIDPSGADELIEYELAFEEGQQIVSEIELSEQAQLVQSLAQGAADEGREFLLQFLTDPELEAMIEKPFLERAFLGSAIHRATYQGLLEAGIEVSYNAVGPDFVFEALDSVLVELTTEGQVAAHLARGGLYLEAEIVTYSLVL